MLIQLSGQEVSIHRQEIVVGSMASEFMSDSSLKYNLDLEFMSECDKLEVTSLEASCP